MCKDTINQRFIFSVNYIISEKIAPTKANIAHNLDIKTSKFSEILNKRMSVSAELLSNFSKKYGISVEWILTGEGNMLKAPVNNTSTQPQNTKPISNDQYPVSTCKMCIEKDERIKDLKEVNAGYKQIIESQQSVIHSLQIHIEDLQQHHFNNEEDVKSQAG